MAGVVIILLLVVASLLGSREAAIKPNLVLKDKPPSLE
jgi:hypothetical protein